MKRPAAPLLQPPEQLRYARILDVETRVGLLFLVISFAAYLLGLLDAQVPVDQLPRVWGLPVAAYLAQTGAPTGWGWLPLIFKGDMAGLAGIVLLSSCSLACLSALVPLYLRRGDRAYALLCVAEVAVVVLAASGLLSGGH